MLNEGISEQSKFRQDWRHAGKPVFAGLQSPQNWDYEKVGKKSQVGLTTLAAMWRIGVCLEAREFGLDVSQKRKS